MKKIKIVVRLVLLCTTVLAIGFTGCEECKHEDENNNPEYNATLIKLYHIFRDGAIEECKLNGELVYCGEYNNVYDGPRIIYDKNGKQIADCAYRPDRDSICDQITQCETIYRVKDNFWGQPELDKYGLAKQ
jgi:hypothetical protein